MRARLLSGVLFIMIGSLTLFLATCDKTVNSGFEDSIELYSYLEPIEGASNATMIVNKGSDDKDSYFQVDISDIETNHLLKSGSHGAWCLEWRKPMRSNNDEHKGVKWYSSIGNEKWKPMNYFFSIKRELEAADPDLTFREIQAVVWSLAGYMGIAPEFDVQTLPDNELPGDLRTDGQPNFSKEKVLAIVDRVKNEYASPAKSKATEEEGCIVGETDSDQQNVCVPTEPEQGRIEIDPNPITIPFGGRTTVHATVFDKDNNELPDANIMWFIEDLSITSFGKGASDGTIITLDGDSPGETTIRAESEGITTTVPLTVQEPTVVLPETITAGNNFSCGLDTNGNAYCWGQNASGQLGNGTTTNSNAPVAVIMPTNITFTTINAGGSHTVALDNNGRAWAWGSNSSGQLGDGTTFDQTIPVTVNMPKIKGFFIYINAGNDHSIALDSNANAWAWGSNSSGQLGDGNNTNSDTPVAVNMPLGISFKTISTGNAHNVALDTNGDAWAWGVNGNGQLGDGTTFRKLTPVAVRMPDGVNFTAISAGGNHTQALTSTGEAWGWGWNLFGQLGDGTTEDRNTPVAVRMPAGVSFTAISTGNPHTVALTPSGAAWAWGSNVNGQLGDGTPNGSNTPVAVNMPAGVSFSAISGGGEHNVALTSTGEGWWAWGWNRDGQLGDGTTDNSNTPVEVLFPLP